MTYVAMVIDTPIADHRVEITGSQGGLNQRMGTIDTCIEQADGRHLPARPGDALGKILNKFTCHPGQFIGEHRGRIGGSPYLGDASRREQQHLDCSASTVDRQDDNLRELQSRIVRSDCKPEAQRNILNALKAVPEAPKRPPHFRLRVVRQRLWIVAPESLKTDRANMLDRLHSGFLWGLGTLSTISGECVVTENRFKHMTGVIRHEERNASRAIRRNRHSTLPGSLALLLEGRRPYGRCKLDLQIDSVRRRHTIGKFQGFPPAIRDLESRIEFPDDPATVQRQF